MQLSSYIDHKQAFSKLKLPSFLLGTVLFLSVAAIAAIILGVVSYIILSSSSFLLTVVIKNADPRGASVLSAAPLFYAVNMVFIGLLFIDRMVYETVNEKDLPVLMTKISDTFITLAYSHLVSSFVAAIFLSIKRIGNFHMDFKPRRTLGFFSNFAPLPIKTF